MFFFSNIKGPVVPPAGRHDFFVVKRLGLSNHPLRPLAGIRNLWECWLTFFRGHAPCPF
jgi:hypothetical protein